MNLVEFFFNPKSIAVIGASHKPGKVGYEIFKNLVYHFKGKVYGVNPNVEPILGQKIYPSLKEIKDSIDLAVIAIPAEKVEQVLKECVEKKVKGVIIISAGFSELGEKGKQREERLKDLIKRSKTRVIGPNVLGIYDSSSKVDTLFLPFEKLQRPKQGKIAFITQSGAVGSTLMDWLAEQGIGISKFVSYGNAMDINECDLLEYLAYDEKTKVITMYLEGVKQGKRFIQVVKEVARQKPIIVLKAGKTEKGSKAAASHTGSLAGVGKVYSALFKQFNLIEANDWQELFDYAKAFALQPLLKGKRICIITDGGGFGVLACDEAESQNLELPDLPEDVKENLRRKLPSHVILSNPLDLTGDATPEAYELAMEACLKSQAYDGLLAIILLQVPRLDERIIQVLVKMKKFKKPILCCSIGSSLVLERIKQIEGLGIPVYPTPERAIKAFAAMVKYSERLRLMEKYLKN